jgi:hypothetical protein
VPTDDIQRIITGTAPAPAKWVVPGNGQMRPKDIFASYDGTGAAGPFFPTLKIISDGGKTVGIFPTGTSVAAGASADVTWFPGLGTDVVFPNSPGSILGVYGGDFTVADFTTNSNVYVSSGYPSNPTFTKVSNTSAVGMFGQLDFTPGAAPDVIFCAVFVDGVNTEATGCQIASAGSFVTAVISTVKGAPGTTPPPLAAGNHTVDVRVACNAGANFTLRCSTSVDLTFVEFVA